MSERFHATLDLIRRGARIFPLHGVRPDGSGRFVCTCGTPDCNNAGKHPLARLAPRGLKNASAQESLVRRWFGEAPHANIGLATGRTIVIDVDPRHGGGESLAALEVRHGPLPHTLRALTGGGGEHIFFRPPDGLEIRNSAGDHGGLAPGLDIRGIGGYVVAPPSLHISGRAYAWSVDHHPDDVRPAEMPAWLVAALVQPKAGARQDETAWPRLAAEGVTEGGRNVGVARLDGHLLRRFVDPETTHELLQAWNAARCRPPLASEEVTKAVGSIARKELRRRETRDGSRR